MIAEFETFDDSPVLDDMRYELWLEHAEFGEDLETFCNRLFEAYGANWMYILNRKKK